jgi:hypothetical protein
MILCYRDDENNESIELNSSNTRRTIKYSVVVNNDKKLVSLSGNRTPLSALKGPYPNRWTNRELSEKTTISD